MKDKEARTHQQLRYLALPGAVHQLMDERPFLFVLIVPSTVCLFFLSLSHYPSASLITTFIMPPRLPMYSTTTVHHTSPSRTLRTHTPRSNAPCSHSSSCAVPYCAKRLLATRGAGPVKRLQYWRRHFAAAQCPLSGH